MYCLYNQAGTAQKQQVVETIIKAADPEQVFWLGATGVQRRTESLFLSAAPGSCAAAHYFVLVLITHSDSQTCSEVQDRVENSCRHEVPVTAIVLEHGLFNRWLREGRPFAGRVREGAPLLYDSGRHPLDEPGRIDEEGWKEERRRILITGVQRAGEFLAAADLLVLRKHYRLAAFLLHQAAEQALLTLVHTATGLRVATHNLDKLLRYGTLVHHRLPEVFPREREKERQGFALLQRAYIEARYKEDFSIGYPEMQWLTERVRELLGLLKEEGWNEWKEGRRSGVFYQRPEENKQPCIRR